MENFWVDLLQKMLVAFLPLIASALVGLLVAWARVKWAEFKSVKPDIAWMLEQAATIAVKAAEQAGASGYIENKKQYALDIAEKWLAANGVPLDLDLIDAAIEAAVFEELNKDKLEIDSRTKALNAVKVRGE